MWETGSIMTDLGWILLLLITKGNADTWGIGLLEVFWKVVEAVIDTQIKSVIQFHDVLHGFCAVRRTGTDIMELKSYQELVSKCGPGSTIYIITIPNEGVRQPLLGETTTNSRGLWDGTKTIGVTSGILVQTVSSHSSEWIS